MKIKNAAVSVLGTVVFFGITIFAMSVDANLNGYGLEEETTTYTVEVETSIPTVKEAEPITYSWKDELIAKVTGFEVGNCCPMCQYYVASACVNRMNDWYGGDPYAMVTDNNGEYYMMNPDYAEPDFIEVNDWNYYEHCDEMLDVVAEAKERPADVYYWDDADTQGEWADIVFVCTTDWMWFYQ